MDLELALNLKGNNSDLKQSLTVARGEMSATAVAANNLRRAGILSGNGLADGGKGAGVFRQGIAQLNTTSRTLVGTLRSGIAQAAQRARSGLIAGAQGARHFLQQSTLLNASGNRLSTTLSRLGRVAGTVTGLLGGISLGLLLQDMTQTIFQTELLEATLLSAVGGARALAEQGFAALEDFASRTPFAVEQSVQAFIKMQNLGIRPTEERMAAFGNVSAAMGRDLNQMIEAVADAATGEFERLKEFGIKASQQGDQVRLTFQGVTTTLRNNSESIVGYLTDIGRVNFAGAMQNQMQRLPGLWSNFKDNIEGTWRALGDQGVTNVFATWLSAGVQWTSDIRQAITAGWFGWVRAELDAQLVRFSAWGDLARSIWEDVFTFGASDNGTAVFGFLTDAISFVIDAAAQLPINLRAYYRIAIGEFGKLSENIQIFGNTAQLAWQNTQFAADTALLAIQEQAAVSIESIINRFGDLVAGVGETLAQLNATSVGDALVPDGVLDRLQATGAELQNYGAISAGVRQEIAATTQAHAERIEALAQERNEIEIRRELAEGFIDDTLAERQASLDARDAKIAEAQASAASARAAFEHNRANRALVPSIDEVSAAIDTNTRAQEFNRESLDGLLDRLDPVRVSQRRYTEGVEQLEEALAAGVITQLEFNAAVGALEAEADRATRGTADNFKTLEDSVLDGVDRMVNAGKNWLSNFFETGKLTLGNFKSFFSDWVADMVLTAVRNPIALSVTAEGTANVLGGGSPAESLVSSVDLLGNLSTALTGGVTSLFETLGTTASNLGLESFGDGFYNAGLRYGGGTPLQNIGNIGLDLGAGIAGKFLSDKVFGETSGIGSTLGGLAGTALIPIPGLGALVGSFVGGALEKGVSKLFGEKNNGDNTGRATFDLATGVIDPEGIGNSFEQENVDLAETLANALKDFSDSIGGSTFASDIEVGNRSGITLAGDNGRLSFDDAQALLDFAFREVVENATSLDPDVQAAALSRSGDADALVRDLNDAQTLQNFLANGRSVFDEVDSFGDTFSLLAEEFRRDGETFQTVLTEIELGIELLATSGNSVERTVDGLKQARAAIDLVGPQVASNIIVTVRSIGDGLRSQFAELSALAGETNLEAFTRQINDVLAITAAYDGTVASSQALAQATIARRESELALLAEINNVTASVIGRIGDFREELILGGLDQQAQYERFRTQIGDLTEQLAVAGSAAEVDRISEEVDRLSRSAFGVLDEEQRDDVRPELLQFLDTFEELATSRLGEFETGITNTSDFLDTESQRVIWENAGLATENLQAAVANMETATADQSNSSAELSEASTAINEAASALNAAARLLQRNTPVTGVLG